MDLNFRDLIKKTNLESFLTKGNFGLEKENLRVDKDGRLALTPHPEEFGDKLKNPYITIDFSESQLEMITPSFETVEKAYTFLENIHDIVSTSLKNEYLWPQSIPPILPEEDEIPIGVFHGEEGKLNKEYRERLSKKYGKKLQLLSGIHYNFSFSDKFLEKLYDEISDNSEFQNFQNFKNQLYLKIARNHFRYGWIFIYLFGASSPIHATYRRECIEKMSQLKDDSYYFEDTLSFRNGICGYKNIDEIYVSHSNITEYVSDIKGLIKKDILQEAKEYYSSIRLKSKKKTKILDSLEKDGVEYLEFRSLDLNPFSRIGVDIFDLEFVHLFIIYLLLKDETTEFGEGQYKSSVKNQELLATMGRNKELLLDKDGKSSITARKWAGEIIDEMTSYFDELGILSEKYREIINFQKDKIENEDKHYVSRLLKGIKEEGFINFHLEKAKKSLEESRKKSFALKGYEDLELSTQIVLKEAIKRGVKFEIVDRSENFVLLDNGVKKEYIKQATKTSLDSYITALIMENKVVTKRVLADNGIVVPRGENYDDPSEAKADYLDYKNTGTVVKPKSTNFGLGISIFKAGFSRSDYEKAVDMAFSEDRSILVEEFVEGKEYRFFVIGDETVGILHRVPANVIGDGEKSIEELVEIKNRSHLRGKGYKTPLEKIVLGEAEKMFLEAQGKNIKYIPHKKEKVFLRENSNISTGGDSIDYTDDIPDVYKDIAVKASKSAGAVICGVDMMIKDIKNPDPKGNYGVIEINFNPAIHIHCYPYVGKNRELGVKILDALGF
ncbi:bifunctional glutamate--cysteine ligase GshA/glutathione synthetase GshB [uncultured Ilyobacter sp.]|uniref:bifunctional glutamate--cysteine ligase GshA/glutathione synthetase GshB n=1 Tax=uncultured Ilyobacter sp. TaxID=544433 RepID=UPI0029C9AA25|nr:bifunctional glutamate--cysteine ligase GshA/glutathione synthetase GshB [uncultured Ilyobacter sp.]